MNNSLSFCFLRKSALFATLIVGCTSCTNQIFVDSRDITQGGAWNFSIGMNKEKIFEIAQKNNVHAIRPILNATTDYNYLNVAALVAPGDGRAIELDDGHNLRVVYTIARCKVSSRNVLSGSNPPSSISIGDSSENFIINMRKILSEDHMLTVHEVVSSENRSWFVIDKLQSNGYGSIMSYDIWSFEVSSIKPAGAEFIVYFSEGAVTRISYKRPRARIE